MTKKELLEQLKAIPDDAELYTEDSYGCFNELRLVVLETAWIKLGSVKGRLMNYKPYSAVTNPDEYKTIEVVVIY